MVNAADRFFQSRDSLWDAMPAVWKKLSVEQRRQIASLFKGFEEEAERNPSYGVWSVLNVRAVMSLGFVNYDDVHKLRVSYLASKEDPSVFVDPVPPPAEDKKAKESRQLTLDTDYTGFSFAPSDLMEKYVDDKARHSDRKDHSVDISAKLYRHMANFIAMQYGWHTGGNLIPSSYLHIFISDEQIDLLNPTPRDVQMGAIIDQCSGKKATKKIAKRRIEFIEGNVNSYARILNGPQQLERIKTFNDLASSIATLHKEKEAADEKAKEDKKEKDKDKADKKADKDRKAKEEHVELAPGCKDDVEKGIDHVLTLKQDRRKQILKIHFGVSGLSKMLVKHTEAELRKCMASSTAVQDEGNNNENATTGTVGEIIASIENTVADTGEGDCAAVACAAATAV